MAKKAARKQTRAPVAASPTAPEVRHWGEQQPGSEGGEGRKISFFRCTPPPRRAVVEMRATPCTLAFDQASAAFRLSLSSTAYLRALSTLLAQAERKCSTKSGEECACIMLFPVRRRRRGVGLIECSLRRLAVCSSVCPLSLTSIPRISLLSPLTISGRRHTLQAES